MEYEVDPTDTAVPNQNNNEGEEQKEWRGNRLAPFGQAARMIWLNLIENSDGWVFSSVCLLWVLIEIQAAFEAALKRGNGDLETAFFLAKSHVLTKVSQKQHARASVLKMMEQAGHEKAVLSEACDIVHKILDEVDKTEEESDPGTKGADSVGKSRSSESPKKSRRKS